MQEIIHTFSVSPQSPSESPIKTAPDHQCTETLIMTSLFQKQLSPGTSNNSSSSTGQSGDDDQEVGSNAVPKINGDHVGKKGSWLSCFPHGEMDLNPARMVRYIRSLEIKTKTSPTGQPLMELDESADFSGDGGDFHSGFLCVWNCCSYSAHER